MKHTKTIIALGVIVALVPFLGFPSSWKNIMFLVLGCGIATLGFRLYVATRTEEDAGEASEYATYQQSAVQDTDISVAHE